MLPHIFERGVSETGSGLGLPICKTVIEDIHNGNISIDSKYGFGTQVTMDIPIHKGAVEND
jgi:signal transduction histidine kinase